MEFSTTTTTGGPASPFAAVARPSALTRQAGAAPPTWFEPDTRPASPHPHLAFSPRTPELAVGSPRTTARTRIGGLEAPAQRPAAPPPLISTAPVTPVVLPRPVVALTSEHERSAPDAAIVALVPQPALPTATDATGADPTSVISA